jgi:Cu+-exporting ATPase
MVQSSKPQRQQCFHCGLLCPEIPFSKDGHPFCCMGCVAVYDILQSCQMQQYYQLVSHPGTPPQAGQPTGKYSYLDDPASKSKLLTFSNGKRACATLEIPAIHCASCIWLLENLYRLSPGIERVQVEFLAKRIHIEYAEEKISLAQIVGLLSKLGYEPRFLLQGNSTSSTAGRRVVMQLGVAAFCFLNAMLFSFPEYLAAEELPPRFRTFFAAMNLLLSLPALFYAGWDWLRYALIALRRGLLSMDVPVAAGLLVLFARSAFDILTGSGPGYCDSLCGFVFFLLLGRWCQQKSFAALSFDRDYKAYFPLSILRETPEGDKMVTIDTLLPGDVLSLRNQELIPADSQLLSETATLDYSFVTGEAELQSKKAGDHLLAGGKIVGNGVRLCVEKTVVHSFLVSLWNLQRKGNFRSLTDTVSPYFAKIVLLLAGGAALYWGATYGDWGKAIYVLSSVLIVACPCALAISAPFVQGALLRTLEKRAIFVKNGAVLEKLANASCVVFDKTGTLTRLGQLPVLVEGALAEHEKALLASLARQSLHPVSVALCSYLGEVEKIQPQSFAEFPGQGIAGQVAGESVWIGRLDWVVAQSGAIWERTPGTKPDMQRQLMVAIGKEIKATFTLASQFRDGWQDVLSQLARHCELHLLSGDTERERDLVAAAFPEASNVHFYQDPWQKTEYIKKLQTAGKRVVMLGDGLNDAGAFRQSDVAIAISEDNGHFAPACDIIMRGQNFCLVPALLAQARQSMRIVYANFLLSLLYNSFGILLAMYGVLVPWLVAVLMPLSSISVILVAHAGVCYLTRQGGEKKWK